MADILTVKFKLSDAEAKLSKKHLAKLSKKKWDDTADVTVSTPGGPTAPGKLWGGEPEAPAEGIPKLLEEYVQHFGNLDTPETMAVVQPPGFSKATIKLEKVLEEKWDLDFVQKVSGTADKTGAQLTSVAHQLGLTGLHGKTSILIAKYLVENYNSLQSVVNEKNKDTAGDVLEGVGDKLQKLKVEDAGNAKAGAKKGK